MSSLDARLAMVRWAADEAAARHAELRLVNVCAAPALPDQYLPAEPVDARRAAQPARSLARQEHVVAALSGSGIDDR